MSDNTVVQQLVYVQDADGYIRACEPRKSTQVERDRQEFLLLQRVSAQSEAVPMPLPVTQVKA